MTLKFHLLNSSIEFESILKTSMLVEMCTFGGRVHNEDYPV